MGIFGNLFDGILKILAIVVAIIAIVYLIAALAVYYGVSVSAFALLVPAAAEWTWLSFAVVGIVLGVASVVISKDGFDEVFGVVADAVGTVTSVVATTIGSSVVAALAGASTAIPSWVWIGAGVVGLVVLGSSKAKPVPRPVISRGAIV